MDLPKKARVILAAGGVVRCGPRDPRIAVVRRAKYDDWSLPKGKLDPGETFTEAAVREVFEEAACRAEIREFIGAVDYQARERPKVVLYYAMDAVELLSFEPNTEIEALEWITPREAAERLTYGLERQILGRCLSLSRP